MRSFAIIKGLISIYLSSNVPKSVNSFYKLGFDYISISNAA